ncbi:MAG: hypothetical protein FJ399_16130 [Verrucomicrobia bacterium]|nr:hypothetical protein [Verrucomicrobiota bacterium]
MSAPEPSFTVGFKQLSPDAKRVDLGYGEQERTGIGAKELRNLLRAAEAAAPQVNYPLAPEMRIVAPTGRYVVQLKDGRLNCVSWSSARSRGGNPTADQIFAIISGEEVEDDATQLEAAGSRDVVRSTGRWRWALGSVLVVIIIGANLYSVYNYRKPPGNLLPPFRLQPPEPAKRLLESVAGNYETGGAVGDRRLQIKNDGGVAWIKFGPNRSVAEERLMTAQGAESGGRPALFTDRKSLILIKDATNLVLFGDTYQRVR